MMCRLVSAAAFLLISSLPLCAQTYSSEREVGALRLGQKVFVDDGSCPAGQIKELAGVRLVTGGVEASRQCIPQKARR